MTIWEIIIKDIATFKKNCKYCKIIADRLVSLIDSYNLSVIDQFNAFQHWKINYDIRKVYLHFLKYYWCIFYFYLKAHMTSRLDEMIDF